jgi:hypothetical protein
MFRSTPMTNGAGDATEVALMSRPSLGPLTTTMILLVSISAAPISGAAKAGGYPFDPFHGKP